MKFISKSVQNYNELNNLDMLDMSQIRSIHKAFTLKNELNFVPKNLRLQNYLERGVFNRKTQNIFMY